MIACRALEAHTDSELKVTVVVFHQRDEAQRSQLATLLRGHSGEMVEVQAGDGTWRRARMVRLKSCFGRGLLLLPAPAPFSERSEFILRMLADSGVHEGPPKTAETPRTPSKSGGNSRQP
jgi:hypothetical protein